MAVTPTSTSNAEITANNTAMTYITPTFVVANANTSNGSTFRITVSGQKVGNTGINNSYESGDQFNILWGANNNTTDNVMYSVLFPIRSALVGGALGSSTVEGNPYIYKQFLLTVVNYQKTGGNANLWLTIENSGTYGNIATGAKPFANANSNSGATFLGIAYQAISGQSVNVYFDTCIVEQLI